MFYRTTYGVSKRQEAILTCLLTSHISLARKNGKGKFDIGRVGRKLCFCISPFKPHSGSRLQQADVPRYHCVHLYVWGFLRIFSHPVLFCQPPTTTTTLPTFPTPLEPFRFLSGPFLKVNFFLPRGRVPHSSLTRLV